MQTALRRLDVFEAIDLVSSLNILDTLLSILDSRKVKFVIANLLPVVTLSKGAGRMFRKYQVCHTCNTLLQDKHQGNYTDCKS